MSFHNLFIGTPYVDISGKCIITNLSKTNEYAKLNYKFRGWNEDSYFRVKAKFYKAPEKDPIYIM
jgi:hypothetical protein